MVAKQKKKQKEMLTPFSFSGQLKKTKEKFRRRHQHRRFRFTLSSQQNKVIMMDDLIFFQAFSIFLSFFFATLSTNCEDKKVKEDKNEVNSQTSKLMEFFAKGNFSFPLQFRIKMVWNQTLLLYNNMCSSLKLS